MRKIYTILLAVLVVLGAGSCNGKGAETTNNTNDRSSKANDGLSAQRIEELIEYIPDHEIIDGSEKAFSPEYYSLLQEAWQVPSDGIGEIGSDEWLYYFISGNGGRDENRTIKIVSTIVVRDSAEVTFDMKQFGENVQHQMILQRMEDLWVIADYDGTKAKLQEYIETQSNYFQSKEWQNYLHPILAANDEFSQEARERQQEVEKWLKSKDR